jgi:signal peptidase II
MSDYSDPSSPEATQELLPQRRRASVALLGGLSLGVWLLDQLSKLLVEHGLAEGQPVRVLGPVLSFTHQHNTGAAFGLFRSGSGALTIVAVVVIAVLLIWGRQVALSSPRLAAGIGVQLGGAVGNLFDRLRHGYVTDFIDLHFWPVFNVADIGITVGAVLIVWALLRDPRLGSAGHPPRR